MDVRTTILWIHAIAGGAWAAACGCFVIAGLAVASGSEEQRNFALKAAPKIDGFNVAAATVLVLTGVVNLALAGIARNFNFSAQFGFILGIKVALFVAMAIVLGWTARVAAGLRASTDSRSDAARAMTRMVRAHGAIAAMGGIALLLGLWLMGS